MTRSLVFLLGVIGLVGCQGAHDGATVVRGTIAHHSANDIVIGEEGCALTEGGDFHLSRTISEPETATVRYRDVSFDIFVEPGETLEISFDEADIDNTIEFNGKSPETNLYLYRTNAINRKVANYFDTRTAEWVQLFSKDEPAFIEELNSLKALYLDPLQELQGQGKYIHPTFVSDTKTAINFAFDLRILNYPEMHQRYTGSAGVLSSETGRYLNEVILDDPRLLEIDGYEDFGDAYLSPMVRAEFKTNSTIRKSDNQWLLAAFNVIDKQFKNRSVTDFWQFHYLRRHIDNHGVKSLEPVMERFNNTCLSETLKTELNAFYEKDRQNRQGHLTRTYKRIDEFELDAHIFIPEGLEDGEKRPAIVYFHGGSWSEGKPDWQFGPSKLGFISICIEYRTYDRYGKLPFEQVSDAKSAIRWLRENADDLHIDENRIAASGNSAGGHLALCSAMLDILDEPSENLAVSSRPNALVLNAAVYELVDSWFARLVEDKASIDTISPNLNVKRGLPPMLIFHGTDDIYSAPYQSCLQFVDAMKSLGNEVHFVPIVGVGHRLWLSEKYWQVAGQEKAEFFEQLGYVAQDEVGSDGVSRQPE
jgi:acetyl esterase/lipase